MHSVTWKKVGMVFYFTLMHNNIAVFWQLCFLDKIPLYKSSGKICGLGWSIKIGKKIRIHFVIYLSMPTRENPVGSHKENICGYGMKYKLTK